MLDLSQTRPQLTFEWPLSLYAGLVEEGMGMQFLMENGVNKVTPGTGGASTNLFAGVAMSYFTMPATAVAVDYVTLDSGTLVSGYASALLSNNPISSSYITAYLSPTLVNNALSMVDGNYEGGTQLTYASATPDASHFTYTSSSPTVFTTASGSAGKVASVVYRYNLTVTQAMALTGTGVAGGVGGPSGAGNTAAAVTGTIGIIQKGIVFTNMFDVTANWGATDVANITLATGGNFQIGGTGAAVNANVFQLPSASSPFLGLYLRG
jgi:hypothetical protein